MKNEEMECSQCGFTSKKGQHFCGNCGQKLDKICTACDSTNPPSYKFCGQCGKDLRLLGTIILDRTGLIVKMDKIALSIFEAAGDNLLGKPFSVFVNIGDRASFFSYWNMVLRSFTQQDLDVELALVKETSINTHLTLKPFGTSDDVVDTIQIELEDITDHRRALGQLEEKGKTLEIIDSLTEIFHPAKRGTREKTINGVLEKIGVGSGVQYAFVSRIDSVSNLLFTEFKWYGVDTSNNPKTYVTLPLEEIHPVLGKLLKDTTYIIEDFSVLSASENRLWKKWHPNVSSQGAIVCELIYRGHQPVGIIGFIRSGRGEWQHNALMLMKLSAQLISETLPGNMSANSILQRKELPEDNNSSKTVSVDEVELIIDDHVVMEERREADEKMLIEPNPGGDPDNAQRVFITDDGAYVLQCPKCERNEVVSADPFNNNGWVLKVTCSCSYSFNIIREMRKLYRKDVQFPGSFSRDSADMNRLEVGEKWFSMEVENISKSGLKFKSPMTRLLHEGDNIQLRFNLDNSKESLINKLAMIKSINNNSVGCQFQNSGKDDTTLGFYFL